MASTIQPDAFCHSYLNEKKFNYKWTLYKYSSCNLKNNEFVSSSLFTFNYLHGLNLSGYLMCYPNGFQKEFPNYLSLGIKVYNKNIIVAKAIWSVTTKLSLLDNKGDVFKVMQLDLTNTEKVKNIDFIKHEDLNANKNILLPDDNLTILCEIKYVVCKNNLTPKNLTFERIETKLNNDLVSLFESGKHWDVTLVADGHELHAHKCILASRSDVFAAMFEHQMEENKSNRVIITDCDHEVLKEMLRYIYTGKSPNLYVMAAKLLAVCDKYGLENLKYMCEDELGNRLTIDSVAETLILADLYRANELKEHTIHFMNTHAEAVTKTEGWKKLANNHFHLIAEVYLKLVK